MTTMSNTDINEKFMQSFRVPLEIVREDPKHEQYYHSTTPAYGGDLLITVAYRRNVVTVSCLYESQQKRLVPFFKLFLTNL